MPEKACGNCERLCVCAYARKLVEIDVALHWTGKLSPFSWYDIAEICKQYKEMKEVI